MLLIGIILVLISANVYYYLNIYQQQVNFQKNILSKQSEICSWEIEHHLSHFMSDMNFILFTEDISLFFDDPEARASSTNKIEVFFDRYMQLVSNISLYDDNNNVFTIFKDRSNNLITNIFISREQRQLREIETLEEYDNEYVFFLPAFRDNRVFANIEVRIDTRRYVEFVFDNYYISNTLWQWLVDSEGNVIFSNFPSGILRAEDTGFVVEDVSVTYSGGSLVHKIETPGGPVKVISTYYPIRVMNHNMLVVFSLDASIIVSYIIKSIVTISAATFIVLVVIIIYFIHFIRIEQREKQRSRESELAIKKIFESLPMGIIIKRTDNRIRMINSTALDILKLDSAHSVLGKDISNLFFLFRNYPADDKEGEKESTSEFVYYDPDENEVILYKKEIPATFMGERVLIEAFIDITPIEDARKKEFHFGEAKTEFLKRIGHDIRNPLSGILYMTDALESEAEGSPSKKEKTDLIRKCCDDILSVVNDIVDFSGFETGTTLAEEIPFELDSEIGAAVEPLTGKAVEQKLDLKVTIGKNVPNNLIGDPYHLRHVLTNLISNSIKYTEEGEIRLIVEMKRQLTGIVLLDFTIEDTGAGISPDKLKELNETGSKSGHKSPGNYGINKARQLIQLLKGDLRLESPLYAKDKKWGPGTRAGFYIQVYSNEASKKNLNFDHIRNYRAIRSLVMSEPGGDKSDIQKILGGLGIACYATDFNESIIYDLKSRMADPADHYSIIFIIDSDRSNGFSIARQIHKNNLDQHFLIVMISSANKPGDFIKSKRFGVDHYLIEPYEGSEIFDIIQDNFRNITIPVSDKKLLKKVSTDLQILVVEDNAVNQLVAESMFKSLGYSIDLAVNGKEAINKIREKEYDIVFMDLHMPVKNGLDATCEIREMGYKMPIVAMTANVSDTDRTEAMQAGMNEFVAKPVRIDILKNILIKRFSKYSA